MAAPNLKPVLRLKAGQQLFKVIEAAVKETLKELFALDSYMKSSSHAVAPIPNREVQGMIGFVQDQLEGTLSVGFSKDTLFKILTPFYGEELTKVDDRVLDGVGELTNTIFGIVKGVYSAEGFQFDMCLPMVAVGEVYFLYSYQPLDLVRLEFATEHGPFWIEIFVC
jgi:CheY-specific phosphatase CheX